MRGTLRDFFTLIVDGMKPKEFSGGKEKWLVKGRTTPIEGFMGYKREDAEKYSNLGCWLGIPLGDIVDRAAELSPDKEALVEDSSRLTFSHLREKVDRLAIGLIKLGIKKGDHVLVQLPNWSEFVYSVFALQKIGAIAILLLPRHMQIEINHFCNLTRAKAWIVPEKHRGIDYLPIIDDVRKANPHLEHIILVRPEKNSQFISLEKLIQDADVNQDNIRELSKRRPDPIGVAIILSTGGTTGLPKAVPRTHNDLVCEANYKARAREQSSHDICLITIPLEHNLGFAAMNSTIFSFGKIVLLDSTKAEDFCAVVQREKVTRAPIVSALVMRIINFDGLKSYDLSSLRALYVGGAKTPPQVIRAIHEKIGHVYITAFGMSEGPTCTTRLDDAPDIIFNSIGRPCCPYDEFKVVSQDGRELPPNTEGELAAKGPGVFAGYLKLPEENKKAFTKDGFFRTGDLAIIDAAGYIKITGRIKDIIIRGGENISPSEIEELIITHPSVEDVSVIGMPDKELGERVCAYIKPVSEVKLSLEDIVSFLKNKGASVLQLPERIELVDSIPMTKAGKADKKALREDVKRRLGII